MERWDNISRRRLLAAGGATTAFGGGIAYLASASDSRGQEYVPETFHQSDETTGLGVELVGRPIAGNRDAPVDIYYWTDYLCPFCKQFETETLPDIGSNYIDTGKARLVLLSYPNIGEYSMPAAVWSRCVWAQTADSNPAAHWRWHGAAFDAQADSGKDWADEETFRKITDRTDGVSLSAVDRCRQNRGSTIRESISVDTDLARAAEIQGTPGFVLYNREADVAGQLVGAHPYESFENSLDRVLAA